ncbi:MAG TPA: hypothetical protein VG962_04470 [Steroidobacteraceae bacterium]|nr:hypothetical protein [Steroidobacteraceae bacterium]
MKGLLLSLLFAVSHLPAITSSSSQSDPWKMNGDLASACVLAVLGDVNSEQGAQLNIHCDAEKQIAGNVMLNLPADKWQYKRVTITAGIDSGSALQPVVWIKSLRDGKALLFDSDADQSLWNGNDAATRTMSAVVAGDASSISLGFMLHGKGSVQLHNVHVRVSSAGRIAAQAQQVLRMALELIRQHNIRDDVDWNLLNAQAERFASGAQNTADVYPVIRYVLQRLGDQRSMVLAPEASRMLDRFPSGPATTVKIYSLPDGADLVLADVIAIDKRVANNWP